MRCSRTSPPPATWWPVCWIEAARRRDPHQTSAAPSRRCKRRRPRRRYIDVNDRVARPEQPSAPAMADGTLDELADAARLGGRHMDLLLDELRPIVARWALVLTGSP